MLTNLADAAENRTKWGPGNDAADLDAIRAISMTDYAIAESIANYWEEVHLKPNYRLSCTARMTIRPFLSDR